MSVKGLPHSAQFSQIAQCWPLALFVLGLSHGMPCLLCFLSLETGPSSCPAAGPFCLELLTAGLREQGALCVFAKQEQAPSSSRMMLSLCPLLCTCCQLQKEGGGGCLASKNTAIASGGGAKRQRGQPHLGKGGYWCVSGIWGHAAYPCVPVLFGVRPSHFGGQEKARKDQGQLFPPQPHPSA